jgi:TRAP-type C4-dicarboxylate transport system substrate-binding protein
MKGREMKKKTWAITLVLLVAAAGLASALEACDAKSSVTAVSEATTAGTNPAADKIFELKFSYHTPPQASTVGAYLDPWTDAVEQATNGRVVITDYPNESLVKVDKQYDALAVGLTDIALVDVSQAGGRFPLMEFDTLPMIFGPVDSTVVARVWWDIYEKYAKTRDFKDAVVLGVVVAAPMNYCGNKPATELADFAGDRVRSSGHTEILTVKALGGIAVDVPTSELHNAAESGMFDSCFLSWSAIKSFGLAEVTKYRTECNLYFRAWPILVNKRLWESLGPDIQGQIMSVSGKDVSARYCAANEAVALADKEAIEATDKKAGKPAISVLTAAEMESWRTALTPVWDAWAASVGSYGTEIVADIQALSTRYMAQDAQANGTSTTLDD